VARSLECPGVQKWILQRIMEPVPYHNCMFKQRTGMSCRFRFIRKTKELIKQKALRVRKRAWWRHLRQGRLSCGQQEYMPWENPQRKIVAGHLKSQGNLAWHLKGCHTFKKGWSLRKLILLFFEIDENSDDYWSCFWIKVERKEYSHYWKAASKLRMLPIWL